MKNIIPIPEKLTAQVSPQGKLELNLPELAQQQVEIIILPVMQNDKKSEIELSVGQSFSGFIQNVLAHPDEDIWNDL